MLQKEIAEIVIAEGYIANSITTISVVRVSPDLENAKVYITVYPDQNLSRSVERLNKVAWEIRKFLAQRIRNKMRKVPTLRFFEDDSFKEADRMNKLLEDLNIPGTENEGEEQEL